jgi:hypothetical protein
VWNGATKSHKLGMLRYLIPCRATCRTIQHGLLCTGGILVALAYLLMLIVICGYLIGWKWTGLSKRTLWD